MQKSRCRAAETHIACPSALKQTGVDAANISEVQASLMLSQQKCMILIAVSFPAMSNQRGLLWLSLLRHPDYRIILTPRITFDLRVVNLEIFLESENPRVVRFRYCAIKINVVTSLIRLSSLRWRLCSLEPCLLFLVISAQGRRWRHVFLQIALFHTQSSLWTLQTASRSCATHLKLQGTSNSNSQDSEAHEIAPPVALPKLACS